jgi:hypothetical protein
MSINCLERRLELKINDTASVNASQFREQYVGMPIYVDQRDHERYYRRDRRRDNVRNPVGDLLEDFLEFELLEGILHKEEGAAEEEAVTAELAAAEESAPEGPAAEELAAKEAVEGMQRGNTIGEIIQENIEMYCRDSMFESWPIAMAYVPWQSFTEIYEPDEAMRAGTIFPALNLPFLGGGRR